MNPIHHECSVKMKPSLASKIPERIRPHILLVTHVIPYPPAAGNEIRLYKMLSWFRRKGYVITLVLKPLGDVEVSNECILGLAGIVDDLHIFDNRVARPRPTGTSEPLSCHVDPDLQDSHLSLIQDNFCPEWFASDVAGLVSDLKPDVVIAQYVFMSRTLMLAKEVRVLRIIDSNDLFCRKQKVAEQYDIKNYGLSLTDQQESMLLRRADIVLAIQQVELLELEKLVPDRKILLTSFDHDIHLCAPERMVHGQILIVASGNAFNVQGTQDFIDYIWPLIHERNPVARLRVIGHVCEQAHTNDPTVALLGFIKNLAAEYEQAEVVINPCRVGTGLKIKTIEALAWGKAHVAWPSAADGLHELGEVPFVIAANVVDFADGILAINNDPSQRRVLEEASHLFIKKYFDSKHVYSTLTDEIDAYFKRDTNST